MQQFPSAVPIVLWQGLKQECTQILTPEIVLTFTGAEPSETEVFVFLKIEICACMVLSTFRGML